MDYENQTVFKELILIGFSQNLQARILMAILFSIIYLLTILVNSFLIFTIIASPRLHTPMYYFLCNLSFIDMCYTSCSVPKILYDTVLNNKKISVIGCLTQMHLSLFLGVAECILLAVMAYDRYIAICSPLNYIVIMSWRVCRSITVFIWSGGLVISLLPTFIKPIVICRGNKLDHFGCEILVVLELACDGLTLKTFLFFESIFVLISPLVLIVVSYICIISSILQIRSTRGRSKAFSTCASHLTVVIIFYGTSITMYMGQAHFSSSLKYVALGYGVITPVINPLIYTLRNNDVKECFKKVLTKYSVKL